MTCACSMDGVVRPGEEGGRGDGISNFYFARLLGKEGSYGRAGVAADRSIAATPGSMDAIEMPVDLFDKVLFVYVSKNGMCLMRKLKSRDILILQRRKTAQYRSGQGGVARYKLAPGKARDVRHEPRRI